jgi:hypothetical protein
MWQAMKSASNKVLDRSGTVSLEFVLIFSTFWLLFLATCDLGRFYMTANSVRTLASELVRQTLIYCADPVAHPSDRTCTLPASGAHSVATAKAIVPFLVSANFATTPSASRGVVDSYTGVMMVNANVSYPFSFMVPVWQGTISQVSQGTQLGY